MPQNFTKNEAFSLFGKTVKFKESMFVEAQNLKFPVVAKGALAQVYMIENVSEGIVVSVLVDDDYIPFNKNDFDRYCQVLVDLAVSA